MSKLSFNDSQSEEPERKTEPTLKSTEVQADAVVINKDNQKQYEEARLFGNQDSPSEQYIKALDPNDSARLVVEANRFELVYDSAKVDDATKSELELKALTKETKDPVLQVIKILSDFISSLAKSDPRRSILNILRREQQSERISEMALDHSQSVPESSENLTLASLSPPLALAAPEKLEPHQDRGKEFYANTAEKPPSLLKIHSYPGVSRKFWERVDNFARQVPHNLQSALVKNQVRIIVYANSSQLPPGLAEEHARGHTNFQKNKNLPMLYDVGNRAISFIEKPDLTDDEQSWKKSVEDTRNHIQSKGVQDYGPLRDFDAKSIRYEPIERNGWHELGHAVDVAVLHGFTKGAEFDKAYKADMSRIPLNSPKWISYYVAPEHTIRLENQFDRAKKELFAQIFAISLMPQSQLQQPDSILKELFPNTCQIIKKLKV
ncbi:hypothetical protein KA183_10555 [bacterium]|nr:hypothetical protein [bacterium]